MRQANHNAELAAWGAAKLEHENKIESMIKEFRRELPSFWGRRVAKTLGSSLLAEAPLKDLAAVLPPR